MASFRVATLSRNCPRMADVVVVVPGVRTPRMDMQRCSASTTTKTPRGYRLRSCSSAIWAVSRSCTWSRRANDCTRRGSFDSPVMRPSSLGM